MAYENFIQELPVEQQAAASSNAAARSVLSVISVRFPSMQRLMQMQLAEGVNNEARLNEAVRLLSTNSPTSLQQAIAVLSGVTAEAATS